MDEEQGILDELFSLELPDPNSQPSAEDQPVPELPAEMDEIIDEFYVENEATEMVCEMDDEGEKSEDEQSAEEYEEPSDDEYRGPLGEAKDVATENKHKTFREVL